MNEPTVLHPRLDRVLRRCPLLPSEVARIEARLQDMLDATTPAHLVPLLVATLEQRPPALHQQVTEQIRAALCDTPDTDAWHHECRRVATALLDGLHRLQAPRALGMVLYAVSNRLLGEQAVQALQWAQHTHRASVLLAQDATWPWVHWLCQLPLPSLREGRWLEPLIALAPDTLRTAVARLDDVHAVLHQALMPSTSPLRGMLMLAAWVLWARQRTAGPTPLPTTRTGQRIAGLPQRLDHLAVAGHAARQLFAAPTRSSADAAQSLGLLPVAAAAAALLPAQGRVSKAAVPVAAAGLALAGLARAGTPEASDRRGDDHVRVIDALWSLWDSAARDGNVSLSAQPFAPSPGGAYALHQQEVRDRVRALYLQDDFLGALYTERVPPGTLRVRNATLAGLRVHSRVSVPLHPPDERGSVRTWSARTAALLDDVLAVVARAGGCYVHAGPRLNCAVQFHLPDITTVEVAPVATLATLIQQLEAALPQTPALADTREADCLAWLRAQVAQAKASPVRGLAPDWQSTRPDPRSHLGYNLQLARRALSRLSAHPALRALCTQHGADPARLSFPERGAVRAAACTGNHTVTLFQAEQPPPVLAPLAGALRGLSALLHAPVRADGRMQVPEMLAYYGVSGPGAAVDDAGFDACLAALDHRLQSRAASQASTHTPPTHAAPPADRPAPRPVQQAVVDQLWQLFDERAASTPVDLARHAFAAPPGTRLHRTWALGQERLLRLFEAPDLWRAMRGADVSFHSLRVASGQVVAAARAGDRLLHVNTAGWGDTDAELRALFHLADAFGCITPGRQVPLSSVLSFHGIGRQSPTQACQPRPLEGRPQQLQLLHQIHAQWSPHPEADPAYLQATGDLHDVRRGRGRPSTDALSSYRPSLGTAAAVISYGALGSFARLLEHPDLQSALKALGDTTATVSVGIEGALATHTANGTTTPLHLPAAGNGSTPLPALDALRDIARHAGIRLRSDGQVSVADVLAAHGDCGMPHAADDDLLHCAERILGELRLGMRPHLVHAQDLLDPAAEQKLRTATRTFLAHHAPPDTTLLEYLGAPLVARGNVAWHDVQRLSYFLSEISRTPAAHVLQCALLTALDWYGGDPTDVTSPTLLGSLTVSALVADLGPPSDRDARIVLGYRLRRHANRGRTFAAIRDDVDTYLYSLGRLPAALRAMALTLVLQEALPELAADDIPPDLRFGSAIAAVNYVSGVHAAERIQRGLSRQMNFSRLVTLSADLAHDAAVPTEVRQLALDARQLPTRDWLVFRDIGKPRAASAMSAFDQRAALIDAAITQLLAPLPYRMPMVEAELKRVFPVLPGVLAHLDWNTTQLRLCNDRDWFRYSFPLFEVVAAGALQRAPHDWAPCAIPEPQLSRAETLQAQDTLREAAYAELQAGFGQLADINPRFQTAFDAYFANARQGYGTLIEEALYLRPEAERAAIQRGEVELYTLRTHEPTLEAGQETPADTDPYRGRFGVIYRVIVEGRPLHYQLFPLLSRILPLELDGALPVGGVLETRRVRLRHGHFATVDVRRGTPLNVDWDAYAAYQSPVENRTSRVIVERLPFNASRSGNASDPARSPFHALVAPLQQDFFWLDPVAFEQEARAPTSFEAHLQAPPLWLRAVDFIVPFVENLRRVSSKDRDEFAMAAFGLYLEGVLILWPVAGSVAKVLARPGPKMTLPRFGELARVLGHGTVDALNPLAGSLAVARLGVSVVQRGVRGDLHFIWSRLRRPPLRTQGWRWAMRHGMAVLQGSAAAQATPVPFSARTVQGIRDVLVVSTPSPPTLRQFHLLDPATLTPYGPLLQQRLDSSNAAGMLLKVGEGLRAPRPNPGKVLKPIKQGTKASQEDSGEGRDVQHPLELDLGDPMFRWPRGRPPVE